MAVRVTSLCPPVFHERHHVRLHIDITGAENHRMSTHRIPDQMVLVYSAARA